MTSGKLIKKFAPYYRKYVPILMFNLFCASLTTLCEIVFPLIVRYITDTAINDMAKLTVPIILIVGGGYLVLRLIDTAARYMMQNIGHVMGARMETDMRNDLFNRLMQYSFGYYSGAKIGMIMSRLTSDLFEVTEFAHHCPEEFYIAAIKIVVSFIILCTFNVWLSVIVFGMLPIMLLCLNFSKKKMQDAFREQRKVVAEINSGIEDSLLGIRVVKSFNGENSEIEKFDRTNCKYLDTKKLSYKYMAAFHSITRGFDGLMYIAVVVVGSLFLINKKISVGEFTAYLLYITTLLESIRRIIEFTEQFQRGMTGIERFYEIMEDKIDIVDVENAIELGKINGDITFKNVSFAYDESNDAVLDDINLEIKAGENLAIVGASGGGKTTICNLIPRFYEVTDGEILLDGININNVTMESLRRNIGIVQQDVYLFSGTIAENIAYGKPNATAEEVMSAAKAAGAHEFISETPSGYDSYVGERGVKLSGGQKQRISIARVFLKNPAVLILDEATSALDNESERIVKESLEWLSKGRTTITIAHRLSTIKYADRIIVMERGKIVEQGSHNELMTTRGIYYKMNNVV